MWPTFREIAGVDLTLGADVVPAVQTGEETLSTDDQFDSGPRVWRVEMALQVSAVEALGIVNETALMWAGRRWRVSRLSQHSASPIVIATLVREA